MTPDPLDPFDPTLGRRRFLQVGAAGAFLCTIGGETHLGRQARRRRQGRRGRGARSRAAPEPRHQGSVEATEQQTYVTPSPQPGGRVVEYWIQATTDALDDRAEQARRLARRRRSPARATFTATVYQQMTEGFAAPLGPAAIPGPTLHAEVGDTLVVHFRNALRARSTRP